MSTNFVTKAVGQIDTVTNFEEIWGTSFDDTMNGDASSDTFRAGNGEYIDCIYHYKGKK